VKPHCGIADSASGRKQQLRNSAFYWKNRAFLTRSSCDATYKKRAKNPGSENSATGSPSLQRNLRVLMEVHNNKEMGP
jgi:hypothetical protein